MEILSPFTHITLIDDRESEVKHIINFFQEKNIPYTYYNYNGSQDSLPKVPSKFVRVLFMDLYLLEDGTAPEKDAKIVSGRFMSVLSAIIEPNTPYILIVWSKHIEESKEQDPGYLAVVERLKSDKELMPLAVMPLDKTKFLEASDSGQLDTLVGNGEELESAIIAAIKNDIPAYTSLHWSNLIGVATNNTLGNLREIIACKDFDPDFVERLLFEFARAYLGKNTSNNEDKYKSSLQFITDIFKDNLEEQINGLDTPLVLELNENSNNPPTEDDFANINSKTLFSNNNPNVFTPGNVYRKSHEDFAVYYSGFYFNIFNIRKKADELLDSEEGLNEKKAIRQSKSYFKQKFAECTCITVNVTPVCDFAQKKFIYHKYCQGILLPYDLDLSDYLNRASYYYFSPQFLFIDKKYLLILDLRLTTHDLCDTQGHEDFLFRLREQTLVDIQFRLSNHNGRPGVVFMDTGLL